ncbi:MAG: serine protease [Planctomycetota bacterium]
MTKSRILLSIALASAIASAQAVPEQSSTHVLGTDSGLVSNTSTSPAAIGIPQVVWSTVVSVPGTAWLRLSYDGVLLSGSDDRGSDGSFLRMTSLRDGAVQTQHLVHVEQWRETSAYFNGDSVMVELLAHPQTGDNRLILKSVNAGPIEPIGIDSICGPTDDRALSTDERVGRNQPTGCTSWLINDCNHCFLTAGHCAGSGLQVVEFNVPLSNGNGSLQHPPPSDQYAVDTSSLQTNGGQGVGNDWAYFGVFANSTTNLTPHQANGGLAFDLVTPPSVGSQNIRITGNGSTSSPVTPTWNQVQKTHSGPYSSFTGSAVRYTTDTTGGNSGSPVILDGTNSAIGIHTHGGCSATSGSNAGTGSNNGGLQGALANPQGICDCPALEFAFPNGLPEAVDPNGTTTLRITTQGPVGLQAGTLRLNVSTGGPYQQIVPTAINATTFDATFPATNCRDTVMFYISATGNDAISYTSPDNAPSSAYSATSAAALTTLRNYNFNTTPPGWSVVNTALATGAWTRGTPNDPRGPASDADGSGQCWVTGNSNNEDVDGGPTVLTTETIDLSTTTSPVVSYMVWFSVGGTTPDDTMNISASNDGGATWTAIESVGATADWEPRLLDVRSVFPNPAQFAMRFSVSDNPNNSVTEAALDAFRIDDSQCDVASFNTIGSGCSGTVSPTLQLISLPDLGGTFRVGANNLASTPAIMVVGLNQISATLPAPFAAGCTLVASNDVVDVLNVVGNLGVFSLPIPNDPALDGLQVFVQAAAFGSTWSLSEGGVGEIH